MSGGDERELALYRALVEGKGIQHVVDKGVELFSNPIFVADRSFKLLAHGAPEGTDAPLYREIAERGYYPSEYLEQAILRDREVHEHIYYDKSPAIMEDDYAPARFMAYRISGRSGPVGFCSLLEDRHPFGPDDQALFDTFCKVTACALREAGEPLRAYDRGSLMAELLDGALQPERIGERTAQFGVKLPGRYCVLAARYVSPQEFKRYFLDFLSEQLQRELPGSFCAAYGDGVTAILPWEREEPALPGDMGRFLEVHGLAAGVSNRFEALEDVPRAYRQAVTAVEAARAAGGQVRLAAFRDWGYRRLFALAGEELPLEDLLWPPYLRMRAYDRRYGTAYCETVEVYLECGGRASEAAGRLSIHRNTLDYRVRRARELFGLKLERGEELFRLLLSYRIRDFAGPGAGKTP